MATGHETPLKMPEAKTRRTTGKTKGADFKSEALAEFYRQMTHEPGPKRAKLYRAMLKMIEQGFWNPGDRLPTDLAELRAWSR